MWLLVVFSATFIAIHTENVSDSDLLPNDLPPSDADGSSEEEPDKGPPYPPNPPSTSNTTESATTPQNPNNANSVKTTKSTTNAMVTTTKAPSITTGYLEQTTETTPFPVCQLG